MSRGHSLRRTVSLFVICGVICGCNSEPNRTTTPSGERADSRSSKPGSAASGPDARPELPQASVERIAIQLAFSSQGESPPTYVLPADELARAWKHVNKLVAEEIDHGVQQLAAHDGIEPHRWVIEDEYVWIT